MIPTLTSNTQAILLMTSPLIAGGARSDVELLSAGEYKRLAAQLRHIDSEPADLLQGNVDAILESCRAVVEPERLKRLLGRGFQLSQAVERWHARAIWVVSRADPGYPASAKSRLRRDAPAVLFGCGDPELLNLGGLAVVGSRHVDDALANYTVEVGELAATAGRTVISGGAKGIDQAAMRGALQAGGRVVGVLADSLERQVMTREHRNLIADDQLTLISPYDPGAGFNVGNAMQRNKVIYALADAALVVSSDLNKGGTWAGAVEQLDKYCFLPVYVRSLGETSGGLNGLRNKGALEWPNPSSASELDDILNGPVGAPSSPELFDDQQNGHAVGDVSREGNSPEDKSTIDEVGKAVARELVSVDSSPSLNEPSSKMSARSPADTLFDAVKCSVKSILSEPLKDVEIAEALQVSLSQMRSWLGRMVNEGFLERTKKPAAYRVATKKLFD